MHPKDLRHHFLCYGHWPDERKLIRGFCLLLLGTPFLNRSQSYLNLPRSKCLGCWSKRSGPQFLTSKKSVLTRHLAVEIIHLLWGSFLVPFISPCNQCPDNRTEDSESAPVVLLLHEEARVTSYIHFRKQYMHRNIRC